MTSPFDALAGIRDTPSPSVKEVRPASEGSFAGEMDAGYLRVPIYRAERRLRRKITAPYILRTIDDMQAYTDAVLQRVGPAYSRSTWPLTVRIASTPGVAMHQSGVVMVPGPVQQLALLHEIGHHLVGSDQGHNQTWMDAFLFLITQEMGADIAQKLLDELH